MYILCRTSVMKGVVDKNCDLEVDTLTDGKPVELIPQHRSDYGRTSSCSRSTWLRRWGQIAVFSRQRLQNVKQTRKCQPYPHDFLHVAFHLTQPPHPTRISSLKSLKRRRFFYFIYFIFHFIFMSAGHLQTNDFFGHSLDVIVHRISDTR